MKSLGSGFVFLLGLGVLMGPASSFSQTVREKADVQVVTLRVAARDASGRAIGDLKVSELALSVDGKAVPIDTFVVTAREQPALQPTSSKTETSVGAGSSSLSSVGRTRRVAIFVDESETKSFDRRDVYDELSKFFRQPAAGNSLVLLARFDGSRLHIECPWSAEGGCQLETVARMRKNPAFERLATVGELQGSNTSAEEVEASRQRLCRALMEALALFPSDAGERQLVLVTGGTAFAHSEDIADGVKQQDPRSSLPWGPKRAEYDKSLQPERDRTAFVMWSRAVNPGHESLTSDDVIAKAVERDVAIIPVAAEPVDRDRSNMVASAETRTRDAGASGSPTGTTELAHLLKPSPRLGVGQALTKVADDTGGEPILSPGKTSVRLSEIEGRALYEITFRDSAASDARLHRIDLVSKRAGVVMEYRRGYRIPTTEDLTLDSVMARLVQPGQPDPYLTASVSGAQVEGREVTRMKLTFTPPREAAQSDERELQVVAAAETDDGERTEPVRWTAVGRRTDEVEATFEVVTNLSVPYGRYHWSVAITDIATGLTVFAAASPR